MKPDSVLPKMGNALVAYGNGMCFESKGLIQLSRAILRRLAAAGALG